MLEPNLTKKYKMVYPYGSELIEVYVKANSYTEARELGAIKIVKIIERKNLYKIKKKNGNKNEKTNCKENNAE